MADKQKVMKPKMPEQILAIRSADSIWSTKRKSQLFETHLLLSSAIRAFSIIITVCDEGLVEYFPSHLSMHSEAKTGEKEREA